MPSRSLTHQNRPSLVHIGSVSRILNHSSFCVQGRVLFVFRDHRRHLHSLRLTSLQHPASPDASDHVIDVFLHGRWRPACTALRKDIILEIEAPHVAFSTDADVHSFQLELQDGIPNSRLSIQPKITVLLPNNMASFCTLPYDNLSQNSLTVPPLQTSPPARAPRRRVSTGGWARQYTYSSIADMWDATEGSTTVPTRGEKFDFYGVVIDCRAPCTTRGPDLRSEVVVADHTSLLHGELRTMVVFCFERKPENGIPFRAVGDVIRAHRVHAGRYADGTTGVSTVQAVARFYSTLLLWSHEGTDFTPVASRQHLRPSSDGGDQDEVVTHSITDQDRDLITSLRNWSRSYLFKKHRMTKRYLRTVAEVVQALPSTDFLTKSFDLLCCMKEDTRIRNVGGTLKFVVSDAFFNAGQSGLQMRVESENSMDQLEHDPASQFAEFCPTWQSRPTGSSVWLLIRDIRIQTEGSQRVAVLQVGRKTSTLVWQSANAPLVGTFREKLGGLRVVSNDAPVASHLREHATVQERHVPDLPRESCALNHENGNGSGASKRRKRLDSSAQPATQPQAIRPPHPDSYAKQSTVCSRPSIEMQLSSIAGLREAVSKRKLHPHRIRARARACSVPRDTRQLCRPWCARCKVFMKVHGNLRAVECVKCARVLHKVQRAEMQWAYCVCLNMEDRAGRRLDVWIEGEEGSSFFGAFPAADLAKNVDKRRRLLKLFQTLLNPEVEIDCCVIPYEYEDTHGLCHVASKIFATKLIEDLR